MLHSSSFIYNLLGSWGNSNSGYVGDNSASSILVALIWHDLTNPCRVIQPGGFKSWQCDNGTNGETTVEVGQLKSCLWSTDYDCLGWKMKWKKRKTQLPRSDTKWIRPTGSSTTWASEKAASIETRSSPSIEMKGAVSTVLSLHLVW